MTDIVERLRERHNDTWPQQIGYGDLYNQDGLEAADEIERLREENEIWKSVFPDIAPQSVLPYRSLLEKEIELFRCALEDILLDIKFLTEDDILPDTMFSDTIYQRALKLMTDDFMKKFKGE